MLDHPFLEAGIYDEDEGIATMIDSNSDGLPDFVDPNTSLPSNAYQNGLGGHPSLTRSDRLPTAVPDQDDIPNGPTSSDMKNFARLGIDIPYPTQEATPNFPPGH